MSKFVFTECLQNGLKVIQRNPIVDARGFFERLFCVEEFFNHGCSFQISQINHTYTARKGSIRGMHYQVAPFSEIKLVSCLKGEVWDVAIDLRKNSPTFLQWHAEILSADNAKSLFIPHGFAHGFQTLSDDCELVYLHSTFYNSEYERGVNPLDPVVNINWPLAISEISDRDSKHRMLQDFQGI